MSFEPCLFLRPTPTTPFLESSSYDMLLKKSNGRHSQLHPHLREHGKASIATLQNVWDRSVGDEILPFHPAPTTKSSPYPLALFPRDRLHLTLAPYQVYASTQISARPFSHVGICMQT